MTEAEIAWVAGLLDGEGHFGVRPGSIRISCRMTDEDTIERLHSTVGAGHVNGPTVRPDRKPIWVWDLTMREDVVALVQQIKPWMSRRRTARIDEMLEWHAANPKYQPRKDAAKHGSLSMYTNQRCRCVPCTEASREYHRDNDHRWRDTILTNKRARYRAMKEAQNV